MRVCGKPDWRVLQAWSLGLLYSSALYILHIVEVPHTHSDADTASLALWAVLLGSRVRFVVCTHARTQLLQQMTSLAGVWYIGFVLISTAYIGILFALLIFTSQLNSPNHIPEQNFHTLEFASAFAYNAIAFVAFNWNLTFRFMKQGLSAISAILFVVAALTCLDVGASLTALILVVESLEEEELIAHYIEYSSMLILSVVTLLASYAPADYEQPRLFLWLLRATALLGVASAVVCLAVIKDHEQLAHYIEFSGDIIIVSVAVIDVFIANKQALLPQSEEEQSVKP